MVHASQIGIIIISSIIIPKGNLKEV